MLEAFKQFFTNETVREQAWEATKAGVSYGVDTASEYMPGTKTLLTTAAAVVVGGAVIGGGVVAHRRGLTPDRHTPGKYLPNADTFTRKRWGLEPRAATVNAPKKDKTEKEKDLSGDSSLQHSLQPSTSQGEQHVANTSSHEIKEEERSRSRSRSPSPSRRGTNDQ